MTYLTSQIQLILVRKRPVRVVQMGEKNAATRPLKLTTRPLKAPIGNDGLIDDRWDWFFLSSYTIPPFFRFFY